jgi:hypothetical protein
MRTAQGSFLMETTYTWEVVDGGTLMTLLNIGSPSGLGSLTAPLVARAMPAHHLFVTRLGHGVWPGVSPGCGW